MVGRDVSSGSGLHRGQGSAGPGSSGLRVLYGRHQDEVCRRSPGETYAEGE